MRTVISLIVLVPLSVGAGRVLSENRAGHEDATRHVLSGTVLYDRKQTPGLTQGTHSNQTADKEAGQVAYCSLTIPDFRLGNFPVKRGWYVTSCHHSRTRAPKPCHRKVKDLVKKQISHVADHLHTVAQIKAPMIDEAPGKRV
jgi:hypothetical protein